MKRFTALLRTTWWLWVLFFGSSVPLIIFVDAAFWATIPVYLVTFVYFAYVRFDEEGNRRTYE